MWLEITVWTTLFSVASVAGIFGWALAVKSTTILNFVLLAYLLREHRLLAACTLGFCPSIFLEMPILAAPCFVALAFSLKRPPFDILTEVFRYPAALALAIAAFASLYAQVTHEKDLLLAPLIVIYLIFTITWAMWARTTHSVVRYLVLGVTWVHLAQAASWALGAPRWFIWTLSTVPYLLFSSLLWFVIAYQYNKHKSSFATTAPV